jgi:hypothetical protein
MYRSFFAANNGRPALSVRVALGALIIETHKKETERQDDERDDSDFSSGHALWSIPISSRNTVPAGVSSVSTPSFRQKGL